jgi:CRP-like cAMP-binding protein
LSVSTIVAQGSALNIALPGLGVDEATCRRHFARDIDRYTAGSTLDSGGPAPRTAIILSGWACETRILLDGRRQIFSFLTPGDVIEILPRSRQGLHATLALTRLDIVDADAMIRDEAKLGCPGLALEIQRAKRRRQDRLFDHVVRLGRQTAYERVVHILLELHERLDAVGLAKAGSFRVPLTQEHLADALGLSLVHVNRTIQQLRANGLIEIRSGTVTLRQPAKLAALVDFAPQINAAAPEGGRARRASSYAEQRL